uniref:Uncharacterized protein n=1 Tax=Kalanchoe fedtschenkoi TaxID=63787 RepID=A0A7N0VMB7_KALFE
MRQTQKPRFLDPEVPRRRRSPLPGLTVSCSVAVICHQIIVIQMYKCFAYVLGAISFFPVACYFCCFWAR